MKLTLTHHGAVDGVTGSCHQLTLPNGQALLVDCGLFQGAETSPDGAGAGRLEINFPLTGVRALIATHVHIDHGSVHGVRHRPGSSRGNRSVETAGLAAESHPVGAATGGPVRGTKAQPCSF